VGRHCHLCPSGLVLPLLEHGKHRLVHLVRAPEQRLVEVPACSHIHASEPFVDAVLQQPRGLLRRLVLPFDQVREMPNFGLDVSEITRHLGRRQFERLSLVTSLFFKPPICPVFFLGGLAAKGKSNDTARTRANRQTDKMSALRQILASLQLPVEPLCHLGMDYEETPLATGELVVPRALRHRIPSASRTVSLDMVQEAPVWSVQLPHSCPVPQSWVLAMVDPDAPNGEHLHWLETSDDDAGVQVPYSGPMPPAHSGPHHYVLMLFAREQTDDGPLHLAEEAVSHRHFNTHDFAEENNLQLVAADYFLAEQ